MEDGISENAHALLEIASERMKLNRSKVNSLLEEYSYDIYPVKERKKQKVFEYALGIQMKLYKGEYADFLRAITPISLDLMVTIMEKYCNVKLRDYIYIDTKNDKIMWSKSKLMGTDVLETLEQGYYPRPFRYGNVYSAHICIIIKNLCTEDKLKDSVSALHDIEEKVRNKAAHEIMSVTDEWIYQRTGRHAEEIMNIIRYLCGRTGVVSKKEAWNSYDDMNKLIIQELEA